VLVVGPLLLRVELVKCHWNFDALEKATLFAHQHPHSDDPKPPAPPINRVSHRLTAADRQHIVDAYLAGDSSRDVGKRFNVAKGTVINLVRLAGHQSR
jgi:DNA-directed RNA polymerase specialized sigma24 family protein